MLTNLFITLGWSRDDLKWFVLQLVAVAGLITSNAFDVPYWCAYLGIPLSPTALHWIFATAAVVLWLAGKYNSSPLPSEKAMASGVVPGSPPSTVTIDGGPKAPTATPVVLPPTKTIPSVLLACLLAGATFSLPACASSGATTPVGQVASAGTKVEQTGSVILQAAQTAAQTPNPLKAGAMLVSAAQLDQVALACDKLGRLGTALAAGLTNYNQAKAAGTNTASLAAAIQSIVADATAALTTIGQAVPNGTVAAIDSAITSALGLYAQIRASVL